MPPSIPASASILWPPGGLLAAHSARAQAQVLGSSGEIAVAAVAATGAGGVLAWSPSGAAWFQESAPTVLLSQPVSVAQGLVLDSASGLWSWGAGSPGASGAGPWTALVQDSFGTHAATASGLWSSGGVAVAGLSWQTVVQAAASGSTVWGLSAAEIWQGTLASAISGSAVSASLGFQATAICTSGASAVVGGSIPFSISSGAYALASSPSGSGLVAFNTPGTALSWFLSGAPAVWVLQATSTGLPAWATSGLTAAWTPAGSQVLLADSASGKWMAFSYTAGTLALLASGTASGLAPGLAISADSAWALLPQPAASGFFPLQASGASWAPGAGTIPGFPGAGCVVAVSGTTFAVGWQASGGLLANSGGTWGLPTEVVTLVPSGSPTAAAWSPQTQTAWLLASGGAAWAVQWAYSGGSQTASGSWGNTGSIVGVWQTAGQLYAGSRGSGFYLAKTLGSVISAASSAAVPGLTSITGLLADGSFAASASGTIGWWQFGAPYATAAVQAGVWALVSPGSPPSVGTQTVLGQHGVPSALGHDASGQTVVAVRDSGGIGLLSAGFAGLTFGLLPAGGWSSLASGSSGLWATTEVQGGLGLISGPSGTI